VWRLLATNPPSFTGSGPKAESNWRGVVLLSRNVQSYKFALARAVLDTAASGQDTASLEQLPLPFAEQLCTHLGISTKGFGNIYSKEHKIVLEEKVFSRSAD